MGDSIIGTIAGVAFRLVVRIAKTIGLLLLCALIGTVVVVFLSGDEAFEYTPPETVVNDITGLNPVHVGNVIRPADTADVVRALQASSGPVSIGGGRFSQGGQISYPGSLHLDMRGMNEVVAFDREAQRITVQSGITWREIQTFIDPHDLAVRIMQTYADFTVGGSLSVNVHGRYMGEGPVVRSVDSIRIVLADGTVVDASPTANREIFYGAIGGYGGIGVIVEATLSLAPNEALERRVDVMDVADYYEHFRATVRDNPDVVFHNADLYPPQYEVVRDVSWFRTDKPVTITDRMIPPDTDYWWQPAIARFVAAGRAGKWLRQHVLEPLYYTEQRVAWRNWEASYDVRELEPPDREEYTYVLREYFVPVARFDEFVPRMAEIFNRHDANIINVSVRHALPDPGTLLAWANEEVFAFVVYYRQGTDADAKASVRAWSVEMIDAVLSVGGTWYLPYQVFATPEQFAAGYPRAAEFFALKDQVDPGNRFRNRLWTQHYPQSRDPLLSAKTGLANYYRSEEQTILTVPEWYLVFNPEEYANFLDAGNNPSDFPFISSVDEYWSLYDRVTAIAEAQGYPRNGEYQLMLQVIGVSTTLEYLVKSAYENTAGRLTRWSAGGDDTPEDELMREAYRAYSNLIFDEAWYEFDFGSWIDRMWSEPPATGRHMLRKWERRLFFTAEFAVKAAYAKLIEFGAEANYGESDKLIYLTADSRRTASIPLPTEAEIIASSEERQLLAVPRWGGFTEVVPKLARSGYEFTDISGNQAIVISLLGDTDADCDTLPMTELFRSRVLSVDGTERRVVQAEVSELADLLRQIPATECSLEHIFDY